MPLAFWASPIEAVLAGLATRADGLTQVEADRQLLRFGPNRSSDTRKITPLGLLLGITGTYLVASELVKGWFFRRFA